MRIKQATFNPSDQFQTRDVIKDPYFHGKETKRLLKPDTM